MLLCFVPKLLVRAEFLTAILESYSLYSIYPNSCRKASSTLRTATNSIANREVSKPFRLFCGMSIRLKPNFSASRMRCSIRLTGRISPESPTSPVIQVPASIAISILEESIALITAKSIAGSLTFMPPAILRKTSFCANLNPTLFSKTASNIFIRRRSNPVADRCGVP